MSSRPAYLDFAATTPLDPRVADFVSRLMVEEYGNAGSRTHAWGTEAKRHVDWARAQVADVVGAEPREVVFTSGATEANNLAILGLESYGRDQGRRHIVSTQIEHKAILEPLAEMQRRGFEVSLVQGGASGRIRVEDVMREVRPDTLLVSVMHVNNETGIIQPIEELSEALTDHTAFLHVDAAQGYGKELQPLQNKRVDLISVSGHKIYGPKGVGALIGRYRRFMRPPLSPIMFGGGHEGGLRPGTLPVPQLAGFGLAAELSKSELDERVRTCHQTGTRVIAVLKSSGFELLGDQEFRVPHIVAAAHPELDSEALILLLRDRLAISNGAACSSAQYSVSHVYASLDQGTTLAERVVRVSWGHLTSIDDDLLAAVEGTLSGKPIG
jgi:cysteine desulfurase